MVSQITVLGGDPKLSVVKNFSSQPLDAPILLGGKLYSVEYDRLTGEYVLSDGYNRFDTREHRTKITMVSTGPTGTYTTEYTVAKDASSGTIVLREVNPGTLSYTSSGSMNSIT